MSTPPTSAPADDDDLPPAAPAAPAEAGFDDRFDARFEDLARLAQRVAFRIVGQREEATDIAQEALARAYARWPQVEQRAGGWVSRVAANLALDHVRARRHGLPHAHVPSGDPAPAAAQRADLVAALRALPRRQRDVVVLRYLADLPEAEVATALGCQLGTVKRHAHRGLAALRAAMTEPDPGPDPGPGAARTSNPAVEPAPSLDADRDLTAVDPVLDAGPAVNPPIAGTGGRTRTARPARTIGTAATPAAAPAEGAC